MIKINVLELIYNLLFKNPKMFLEKKEYLFVISHMRSFSSLLCHILGSNGDISGYGEMQRSYNSTIDLFKLRLGVYRACNQDLSGRYVLDKILSNYLEISSRIFNKVHIIYLIRKPESTIRSIIDMERNIQCHSSNTDSNIATKYYTERLSKLELYAALPAKTKLFIESESIVNDTAQVLQFLTQKLDLSEDLRPTYQTFRYTGIAGFGDPSPTIKQGKVVSEASDYKHIDIDDELSMLAINYYNKCVKTLKIYCDYYNP